MSLTPRFRFALAALALSAALTSCITVYLTPEAAPSASEDRVPVAPVGAWSLDDEIVRDAVRGNDGQARAVVPVRGVAGGALEFSEWPSAVTIPHLGAYAGSEATVAFWFQKLNASTRRDRNGYFFEALVWKAWDTGLDRAYSFSVGGPQAPFHLYLSVGGRSDSLTSVRAYRVIEPQVWYHVVGVVGRDALSLFVDGDLVGRVPFAGPARRTTAPIVLGKASVDSFRERHLAGRIDELEVYDRALTAREVESVYAAQKAR